MKKRILTVVLALHLLFAACIACADALAVRRADGVGESVGLFTGTNHKRYLFLPAYMDGAQLEVVLEGYTAAMVGDDELASGDTTGAIKAGATLPLKKGRRTERCL